MRTLLFLPLLALLAGCGDDLSSFEGIAEAKASAYDDLAKVFDGIHDKASAEAALPKMEAIMKRIHEAEAATMKVAGEPSMKEMEEAGKKFAAAEQKKGEAFMRMVDRLKNDPAAQAVLDKMPQ